MNSGLSDTHSPAHLSTATQGLHMQPTLYSLTAPFFSEGNILDLYLFLRSLASLNPSHQALSPNVPSVKVPLATWGHELNTFRL